MKVILLILLTLFLFGNANGQSSVDSLINVVKSDIKHKPIFDNRKEMRIKLLKQTLANQLVSNINTRYDTYIKIYEEYKDFNFDSAYVYAQKLLRISALTHNLTRTSESKLKLGAIQLSGGMFKETFDCIRQINVHLLPDSVKQNYYSLKSRALRDLAFYNRDVFYAPANYAESTRSLDSAMAFTTPHTYHYYKIKAQMLALSRKQREAAAILKALLVDNSYTNHQRAMVASDLASFTNGTEKIKLIALAAIYDLRSSTKQTRAMFTLGTVLFKQKNLDDAEIILREALDQVSFYGNKPREKEITALLTQVTAQKLIDSESKKNQVLTILIITAVVALIGIFFVAFLVHRRLKEVKTRERIVNENNKKLDTINKQLLEDAQVKKEYIGYFYQVISSYIKKIETIKRNAERKLKAKSYGELLHFINEIDIKVERLSLFHTFDKIFLKLYPDFIKEFNLLLAAKDQIWPRENELLNTNLRVFALMRLGIKDSQTIANILETSISTIYTYKNRIKSKALITKDDFEDRIMDIKFGDMPKPSQIDKASACK